MNAALAERLTSAAIGLVGVALDARPSARAAVVRAAGAQTAARTAHAAFLAAAAAGKVFVNAHGRGYPRR